MREPFVKKRSNSGAWDICEKKEPLRARIVRGKRISGRWLEDIAHGIDIQAPVAAALDHIHLRAAVIHFFAFGVQ